MIRLLFLLTLMSLLISCEKELDFKYHNVESQFVIEGTLSGKGSKINLSYTIPMDESFPSKPVVDAVVTIKDLTDEVSYSLSTIDGAFVNNISGIPNHLYELSVNHAGKTFKSSCLMRKGVEILDLRFQWIKMPYDYVAILEITNTVSEEEGTCYWTKIYKNGESYKWLLSHGSGAVDGKLNQTFFTTRQNPDDEDDKDNLREGDIIKVVVVPISLEMYDYLMGISSDSNGPAMFSGDFCLGYFLAAEEAESSIIFHPSEIPYF